MSLIQQRVFMVKILDLLWNTTHRALPLLLLGQSYYGFCLQIKSKGPVYINFYNKYIPLIKMYLPNCHNLNVKDSIQHIIKTPFVTFINYVNPQSA
jgi:hypothetical protein